MSNQKDIREFEDRIRAEDQDFEHKRGYVQEGCCCQCGNFFPAENMTTLDVDEDGGNEVLICHMSSCIGEAWEEQRRFRHAAERTLSNALRTHEDLIGKLVAACEFALQAFRGPLSPRDMENGAVRDEMAAARGRLRGAIEEARK